MSNDDTITPQTSINLPSTAEQQQSLTQELSTLELSMLEEKKSQSEMKSEIQDVKVKKFYTFKEALEHDRMVYEKINEAGFIRRQNFIRDLDKLAKVDGLEEIAIECQNKMKRVQTDYVEYKKVYKKKLEMHEKKFK